MLRHFIVNVAPSVFASGEHAMPLRTIIALCLSCLALAVSAGVARADCVDDCQASTYCDSTMYANGECNDKLNQCYQQECNKPQGDFGAIAYGASSRAFGYSFDSPDSDAASSLAMSNCRKNGDDCRVVLNFSNSCAAVAAPGDGDSFAIGQGANKEQAQFNAVANCRKKGGGDSCDVQ